MKLVSNLMKGIYKENPIIFSTLGLCPALAITTKLENAIGMGIAFTFVIVMSNIVISLLRNIVPKELRIPTFIVIIATFVTIIEMLLNAYLPDISNNLGIFLSLIVVNCIILGRAEAFASKNDCLSSLFDGLGMGIGYTLALSIISIIREILGNGTITIWKDLIVNVNSLFNKTKPLPIFTSFFLTSSGAYLIIGLLFALINKLKINKNLNKEKYNEHI